MDYIAQSQIGNHFLALLPKDEFEQVLPELEFIKMNIGDPIHIPDQIIEHVYFPISCMFSQVTTFKDGVSVEAGVIGREGVSGVAIALLNTTSPRPTHVQLPGDSFRMKAEAFSAILERRGAFERLMRQFTFAYLSQVTQVIACNSHHRIEERLARWLLMCHDRADGNELRITQEFIAQMLGVHRPGVTMAALALKDAGLITNQRGVIIINDRKGLEDASCECYEAIQSEYNKYLNFYQQ